MRTFATITAIVLLAGCGETEAPKAEEAAATKLEAGLYETSGEVTALTSADKTTPATKLKLGPAPATKGCIGDDGKVDLALFAEAGDKCTPQTSYIRNGRMSVQLTCARAANAGTILITMDGKFTKDSFEGVSQTGTQFYGPGDYKLSRKIVAKRTGSCPAA
jgi:hypothetical protein